MLYYYHHQSEICGPLSLEEIRDKVAGGELPPDVQCCEEGGEAWIEYSEIGSGNFQRMTPVPPPLPDFKKCPFCAEEVRLEAQKCKHCGSSLQAPPVLDSREIQYKETRLQRLPDGKFNCPMCGSSKTDYRKDVGCAIGIIIFISFGIGLIMIPFLPYACSCEACGHKWKS